MRICLKSKLVFPFTILGILGILIFPSILIKSHPALSFSENDIDISWSANTYVPYEYEGRALPSSGGEITLIASLPAGINPKELNYVWLLDEVVMLSGKGKQEFKFTLTRYNHLINLRITDEKRDLTAEKFFEVNAVKPQIIIYKADSSILNHQARKEYFVSPGETLNLIAVPYFFGVINIEDLNFIWSLEGKKPIAVSSSTANKFSLAIGEESATGISRTLRLIIENKKYPSQNLSAEVKINIIE